MTTTPDYWALLGKLNIPTSYKINRDGWSLESHGSHTVNGVQLIPGAPGFNPKAAYLMWTTLFGVPAAATGLTLTGTNGNDTLTGGAENDTFTGGAGADSLIGGSGNDTFNVTDTANDGSDTIDGGNGTDTIAVAPGQTIVFTANDAIITGVENITLGAAASVTLTGQTEGFNITGSTGNETVVGSDGNDTITAGAGADSITGGGGADSITGGAGADVIDVGSNDAAVDTVVLSAAADSFVGAITSGTTNLGASIDVVSNLAVGDRFDLTALGLNTSIHGAAVTSNLAAVTTAGGWGLIRGTYVGGVFTQNTGSDTHTLLVYDADGAGTDTNLGAVVLLGLFGGSAANGMVTLAAPPANIITGTAGNDTLIGTAGNDIFEGLAGADSLSGGDGNDTFNVTSTANDGSDTINGGNGTDTIAVAAGQVVALTTNTNITNVENVTLGVGAYVSLIGQTEPFTITASTGDETVVGGDGNDTISGGAGADSLIGGSGNDTFNVTDTANDGSDTIAGGAGTDTIAVAAGASVAFSVDANISGIENIALGAGASINLTGQTELLVITGTASAERIDAGAGITRMTGGGGADTLIGGNGNDDFYFSSAAALAEAAMVSGGNGTERLYIQTDSTDLVLADSAFARTSGMENLFIYRTAGSHTLTFGSATSAAFPGGIGLFLFVSGSASLAIQGGQMTSSLRTASVPTTVPLTIQSGAGNDQLTLASGLADFFDAGSGNDTLGGMGGNDTLVGGEGSDSLTGGADSDTLTGGAGSDVFVYAIASDSNASTSIDSITDLVLNGATGDRLDFTLTGTLTVRTATVAAAVSSADTISEITGLFNSTNGTEDAGERFTAGGNATAILATMSNGTLLVVDVNGDGAFTALDVVINVTGVTVTNFTTDCFI